MKKSEQKKQVNLISLIAKKHQLKKVGNNTYRVDPCPVCGHFEHFTIFAETNTYHSFSGCCKGGTAFDYLVEVEGLTQNEAFHEYQKLLEVENDKPPSQTPIKKEVKVMDYTEWICSLYQNTTKKGKQHFLKRGIPNELIEKYKLSIGKMDDRECMVLPIWEKDKVVYFTTRFLDDKLPKYKNASGTAQIFNTDYLNDPEKSIVFITEGIFDALSLEAMGYNAMALGGVKQIDKLKEIIDKSARDAVFLTAFDNDEAGQECKAKFSYKAIEIPKQFKDINGWYVNSLQNAQNAPDSVSNIKESIDIQLETRRQPDVVSEYLDKAFHSDIKEFLSHRDKRTGFENLDLKMKGLYPGLYVIGGISSVGKTTFTHQLCDQIAEQGSHVIYFSLEQSRLEMVSKSIARTTAKINIDDAVPSVFIRSGDTAIIVKEAIKKYRKTAENVNIIEGNFNTDVKTIREYVDAYRKANRVNPIVVVDYLQIMPSINERMSDKQRIDANVTELKRMSRDFSLSVFVISSLNRGNYLSPIDFESFKESGGIEYTADVVWGLQLEAINDPVFYKEKSVIEKREKIKTAKNAEPREIELVCLKNRNGTPSFSCGFFYHAKYDFFEPNFYNLFKGDMVKTI
ncbi:DnaB-like helicase C-terminal domain-containing protein [Bacillus solitudinis]|uniref:DnaB-like helicase C-terminal domain-containing protein n=1 Tax=Bacillus solitudinis TaxID=2014074 RepID=UPI000C25105A|nr:DnaB-like helicase C-terminal domain-containing protein [Bacillus solitudinis]